MNNSSFVMTNRFCTRLLFWLLASSPTILFAQKVTIEGPYIIYCDGCITLTAVLDSLQQPNPSGMVFTWEFNGTTLAANSQSITVCEPGLYTVRVILNNGIAVIDTHTVKQLPYLPVKIVSNNAASCNPDSTTNSDDQTLCDKVCPNSTVTYSVQGVPVLTGTFAQISWQVSGAQSFQVNPPFNQTVTVSWGSAGTGSVSVVVFGGSSPNDNCVGETALCITIIEEPKARFVTDPPGPPADTLQVCKGQSVWFENQSQNADTYEWLFGDDNTQTDAIDVQHAFSTPGVYTVHLIARSACLCSDTTETVIKVLDADAATLDCVGDVCPGTSVTYSAGANCGGITWTVSPNGSVLGGGTVGADSITVQWNAGPAGSITLSGYSCFGLDCPFPSVVRIPVIDDNAEIRGRETVCPDATEVYSIEPYGGAGFEWKLSGGGTIVEGQGTNRVSVRWNAFSNPSTTYWLSVKYDNCYLGCGGQDSIPVRIVSPFVVDGPVESCVNTSQNFTSKLTATGLNLLCNWTLLAPDGSIAWTSPGSSSAPMVPFDNGPGLYRLFAVPEDPALSCTEQGEWAIRVPAPPGAPTGIDGAALICPGQTATYTAAGATPGASIQWTIQNGPGAPAIATGNPLNIAWNAAGPYQLSAVEISADGLGCASAMVQLNPQPINAFTLNGPAQLCVNGIAAYSAPAIPGLNYQWSLQPDDAGTIIRGQGTDSINVFWQAPGNHTLSLKLCGQTAALAVQVDALPAPIVNHPGKVCPGGKATVQTATPYATYTWASAAGAQLAVTPTVDLGPGNYALTVTDANGCTGNTVFSINTAQAPNLTVSTPNPTGFCNNSQTVVMQALTNTSSNLTYEWFKDGNPLGVNASTYSTNQYGSYTVQAATPEGCIATAGPILIFEDCGGGGGGGGLPGGGNPTCPAGSITLQTDPSMRCDSFSFQAAGANYVNGSAQWFFGQSGAGLTGTATGDNAAFTFPNAGHYIVILVGQLSSGAFCQVVDSIVVEAVARFDVLPLCPGAATGFEENSAFMPNSGIIAWNWNFGDPASGGANTAAGQMPTHVYASAGIYPVTLTVTANSGCTSSAFSPANIPQPVPPAITPPTGACSGTALAFGATGANINWNFGDPASGILNTAGGQPAYHTFAAGNYTVTATATDGYGCTATATQPVVIAANTLSGAISPANPAPICEGGALTLTAPAGAATYLWSDTAMTSTPTLSIGQEGVYSVTLSDANGCTFTPPPVNVEVAPGPDALIKALLVNSQGQVVGTEYPAHTVCFGEDVRLIAQSTGSNVYSWSTGQTGVSVEFTDDRGNLLPVGTYTYTVTVTDLLTGCTVVTDPFEVTVNPVPTGFSIANAAAPACAGAMNTLSYTGPNPGNWLFVWNTGQTDVPLVTDKPGRYVLRVINEFGCEARSNPLVVLPGPNIRAVPAGCHTRCKPDSLCLPPLPDITAWQWFFNGSPLPGATGPNFIAQASGTYWAELTDTAGCTNQSEPLTLNLLDGYGNILGQVWSDVNNNGVIDAADTLVSNIPVNLLQGATPAGNAQSGAAGDFAFANVLSANYTVAIDTALLPAGWQIVIGQSPAVLSGCGAQTQVGLLLKVGCLNVVTASIQLEACAGNFADYNGNLIAAGNSQTFSFTTPDGCDSLMTVTVDELPASTGALNVSVCTGDMYDYNGTMIPAGTTQDFVLQNYLGCDSVLTVTVGVLPVSTGALNVSVCAGEVYDYNGTMIPAGTAQDFVLQNYLGCDSVLTVNVSTLPVSTGALNVSVCTGDMYDYNGTMIPAGTAQDFVLQNYLGCDSVLTVNVSALPVSTAALNVSVCAGEVYDYNGTLIPAGTAQDFVLQNYVGCDSVLTVSVGTLPVSTGALDVSVCPGEVYDYNGALIPAGTAQNFVLQNYVGCDSVLTVNVAALPVSTGALNVKVCSGEAYDYNGTFIPAGTFQNFVLQNYLGCDSLLTVTVDTFPNPTGLLDVKVCAGEVYDFNGTLIPAGTSKQVALPNPAGCDLILTVNVGVLPVTSGALTVRLCPGETFPFQGTVLQIGQTRQFTLQNAAGCDSILTVTVEGLPSTSETLDVTICPNETYAYNGATLLPGETRDFHFTNAEGCDSTVIVAVSAFPSVDYALDAQPSCSNAGTGSLAVLNPAGGLPPYRYSLDGSAFQDDQLFSDLKPGDYSVWLEDSNGCLFRKDTVIAALEPLSLELENGILPCDSGGVQLKPVVGGDLSGLSYLWSTGARTPAITVFDPGPVWVEVSNLCETLRRDVAVNWEGIGSDFSYAYVPNAFAPLASNPENAQFRPYFAPGLTLLNYKFEVFDRWGNLLFRTLETEDGWPGPFRQEDMQPAVFVWYFTADVLYCGRVLHLDRKGDVTIVR